VGDRNRNDIPRELHRERLENTTSGTEKIISDSRKKKSPLEAGCSGRHYTHKEENLTNTIPDFSRSSDRGTGKKDPAGPN